MADATKTEIDGNTMLVVLGIAGIWGEQVIKTMRGSKQVTDIDDMLLELSDKLNDLRARYEAGGVLNANTVSQELLVQYRNEVNKLTESYRVRVFKAMMSLIGNPLAVNDMLATYGTQKGDIS